MEGGADIYAFDPVAKENYKRKFKDANIIYVDTPQKALKDANVCFIFTEWGEIKNVKPEEYAKLMRTPLVYDGRNIYNLMDMKKLVLNIIQLEDKKTHKYYKYVYSAIATVKCNR